MKKRFYYFAYGSNMNSAQMHERCPESEVVGVGILYGYRLVERLYADVDEDAGSSVPGVLYTVSESDLKTLDTKEGVNSNDYYRTKQDIACNGKVYPDVIVYKMTPKKVECCAGKPYSITAKRDYRKVCSDGADEHGVVPNLFKVEK